MKMLKSCFLLLLQESKKILLWQRFERIKVTRSTKEQKIIFLFEKRRRRPSVPRFQLSSSSSASAGSASCFQAKNLSYRKEIECQRDRQRGFVRECVGRYDIEKESGCLCAQRKVCDCSVTGLGEILPLWQNVKSLAIFVGLRSYQLAIGPSLANCKFCCANLFRCKWLNIEQIIQPHCP